MILKKKISEEIRQQTVSERENENENNEDENNEKENNKNNANNITLTNGKIKNSVNVTKIDKQRNNEKLKVHLGIGKKTMTNSNQKMELKVHMKNGDESLIRKWKLRSIQKLERNSRNITKIDNWTLKKKWFVRLRDELTVKKILGALS